MFLISKQLSLPITTYDLSFTIITNCNIDPLISFALMTYIYLLFNCLFLVLDFSLFNLINVVFLTIQMAKLSIF